MGFVLDTIHHFHFDAQIGQDDPRERIAVLEALDARGDRKMLVARAATLLSDSDSDVRLRAGELLASAGGADAAEAAAESLESDLPHVRDAAVGALAGIGKAAVPATAKRLDHPDSRVRVAALRVLSLIPARSVLVKVATLLSDSDIDVVISAVRTLGQHHESGYLSDLRFVYRRVPESRVAVIEAVRLISAHDALDLLENAIQQEDSELQSVAREALRSIDSPKARRVLRDHVPQTS